MKDSWVLMSIRLSICMLVTLVRHHRVLAGQVSLGRKPRAQPLPAPWDSPQCWEMPSATILSDLNWWEKASCREGSLSSLLTQARCSVLPDQCDSSWKTSVQVVPPWPQIVGKKKRKKKAQWGQADDKLVALCHRHLHSHHHFLVCFLHCLGGLHLFQFLKSVVFCCI